MFELIRGTLKEKSPSRAVVETHGIGYRLNIPLNTYTKLPPLESPILFYLSQVVREEMHALYAFCDREERDLFEILITLSGIGPKTALAIIGHMERASFQKAIASADIRLLSKIPGIGKKTAERLVIEMRDRLKDLGNETSAPLLSEGGLLGDVTRALLHLGYGLLQAQKAAHSALEEKGEKADLALLITAALQKI